MKTVEIENPKTGGRATVPESAVPQHRKAGWRPVGERPDKQPAAEQSTGDAEAKARRRKTEQKET